MKILSIGNFTRYGESNTCLLRHKSLEKISNENIDSVNTCVKFNFINKVIHKLFNYGYDISYINTHNFNTEILKKIQNNNYDIAWIDKGIGIKKDTLIKLKESSPMTLVIGYSPDEMTRRHNQSADFLKSLPYYDAYITTKSYAIDELKKNGAKKVYFVNKSFDPNFHYPRNVSEQDICRLGGDIGFIGAWEKERADSILYLAKKGLNIRVWGGGQWLIYKNKYKNLIIEDSGLYTDDYPKALSSFKINLCFLRKINSDLQTARTMEIPACAGFMLAERTIEHQILFEEGVEAEFFSDNEELYLKCKIYLNDSDAREKIRLAGYQRCISSGYSNFKTLQNVIYKILEDYSYAEN